MIDSDQFDSIHSCYYQSMNIANEMTLYFFMLYTDNNFITFIKLSPKFEYGLCQITKMAAICQFALANTLT